MGPLNELGIVIASNRAFVK